MEAMEAILGRRSVRRYTGQAVGEEVIEQLLRAGMAAPSANNEQPWHFVVIRERGILDEAPNFHPYAQMLKQAPVAVCVCGDLSLEKKPGLGYWILDCAAATENILLAGHALGLGCCWLGIHPRAERKEGLRGLLDLPKSIEPFSLIALGYPAEQKGASDRYRTERVHWDKW